MSEAKHPILAKAEEVLCEKVAVKSSTHEVMECFFRTFDDLNSAVDDNILLFEYGTFDWEGRPEFEMMLTWQVETSDLEFEQLTLSMSFAKPESKGLGEFELWSVDEVSLEAWKKSIYESKGLLVLETVIPKEVSIGLMTDD